MDARLAGLALLLRLDTDLLANCLQGLTEADTWRRPQAGGNCVGFLVAHLVDARRHLATLLGHPFRSAVTDAIATARTAEDVERAVTFGQLREAWAAVSAHLDGALESVATARLDSTCEERLPVDDPSVLGAAAFLAQHDAYHVGQVALLRRQLGHPAMPYGRGQGRR